jgi:hypothetical protein
VNIYKEERELKEVIHAAEAKGLSQSDGRPVEESGEVCKHITNEMIYPSLNPWQLSSVTMRTIPTRPHPGASVETPPRRGRALDTPTKGTLNKMIPSDSPVISVRVMHNFTTWV